MTLIDVNNPPQQGVIYLSRGCNVALTFRCFDGDNNPIDLSGGLEIEIDQGSADAVHIEADISENTASVLIPSEVSDTARSGWQWRVKLLPTKQPLMVGVFERRDGKVNA